jgi:diguanylate cyclase (GGDEF)-like protein
MLGLIEDFTFGPTGPGRLVPELLDSSSLTIGVLAWLVPWSRLPKGARLALPMLGFADIAAQTAAGQMATATIGIWYVLIFVWIGSWNPSRTNFIFAPVAVSAYLVPYAFGAPDNGGALPSVGLVIPVALMVGASLSRKTSAEMARKEAERRLRDVLDDAPMSLFACDADGVITHHQLSQVISVVSPELVGIFTARSDPGDDVGEKIDDTFRDDPIRLDRVRRALQGEEISEEFEAGGRVLYAHFRPTLDDSGAVTGMTSVAFDITDRVMAQRERQQIEAKALADTYRQARTDELTGLPNRRQLFEHIDRLINEASEAEQFALLIVDLDRFKEINDALGHSVGDQLLRQIGARISERIGETDLLARLGGDEFALVVGPGPTAVKGGTAAESVIDCLTDPFELSGLSLHITASVGIASFPDHALSRADLVRCADTAMYRAKRTHRPFEYYEHDSETDGKQRLITIEQLRKAVDNGGLECFFQPKVELRSGLVVGAEALVRWRHPTRGILAPGDFLPLAEQSGLMRPIGQRVIHLALAECRRWHDAGHRVTVAVNLSVTELLDRGLPERVADAIRIHRARPEWLTLEITEAVIMSDPRRLKSVVDQLQDLGVAISIDDFGTGYSTLSYLRDFPLQELKLDRSFVTGIAGRPRDQSIVRATLALARALDLQVVAEGVETSSDWNYLQDLEIEVAQGYFISRPQAADAFLAWLQGRAVGAAEDGSGQKGTLRMVVGG